MFWLHRIAFTLVFLQLALFSIGPVAAAERRLALVFANNAYPGALELQATHIDGANIQRALVKVGFDVRLVLDANKATMLDELRAFVQRLQAANAAKAPGDKVLAFFYFAGHGAQDTLYPGNYIWPTDAHATNSEQLSQSAIKLNDIIDWIAAGEPTSSFLVMDACRNYPFDAESKGVKKGFLAEERDVAATLIGYAAGPGATIVDSNDYSEALAAAIEMPAIDAARAFQEVQIRVAQKTQQQQRPSYYNRLLEIVHLRDGAATSYSISGGSTSNRPAQTTMVTPRPVPPSGSQTETRGSQQTPTRPAPPTTQSAAAQLPAATPEGGLHVAIPPMKAGHAVITKFSGSMPGSDGRAVPNPDGSVLYVAGLARLPAETGGSGEPRRDPGPTARDIGQVYAAAIDPDVEAPDIYVAATSIYGLHTTRHTRPAQRNEPKAEWVDGLFGSRHGGGPGTIWKIDGRTQRLSRFIDITHAGSSNPGSGLGQLAFDRRTRQLFVSDLSTGLIHRISPSGRQLDSFDHGQHGRTAESLAAVPASLPPQDLLSSSLFDARNPATWGFAEPSRRVWGLAINRGRLYYAVSEGPQIWSIAVNSNGAFSSDARLEADLSQTAAAGQEVPRIDFDLAGNLYVGLLGGMTLLDTARPDGRPRPSAVMRLRPASATGQARTRRWSPPEMVASPSANLQLGPGLALGYGLTSNGTADLTACGGSLWLAGWRLQQAALSPQLLHAEPSSGALTAGSLALLGDRPGVSPGQAIGNVVTMAPCLHGDRVALAVPLGSGSAQSGVPAPPGQESGAANTGRIPSTDPGRPGQQGGGGIVAAPRLTIEKQCASCALGGTCECRITLRNIGLVPVASPVGFRDPIARGNDPAPRNMTAISFRTDGNDWRCSGVPGTLACSLPGPSLPPLSARTVTVTYAADPLRATSSQASAACAVLQTEDAISRAARQREACVEVATDVVVTVTGDARCRFATRCSFEATISNLSRGAFLGSLSYIGELTIGGGSISRADIVAIEPTLPCGNLPGAIPFACAGRTELTGRETRKLKLTFRVPDAPANSGDARGRVCFIVAEGTAATRVADRSALVALARSTSAPSNPGRPERSGIACVEFSALARCPGQLKLRGDQCTCLDNQERHSGDQCQPIRASAPPTPMPVQPPAVRPVPIPVLPPIIQPPPRVERAPDRIVCERPRVLINGRCEYPMVECYGRPIPINQPCLPPTKDCHGKQIPINQACPAPTKDCYGKQIPINQACPAPTKDCYGRQIPISQACPAPTKDCYGKQIPINQACPAPTKDCYGRQIPISQACPAPTKDCHGKQIPINQACPAPTKDCHGRQIPINQACPAPTKDCYGKQIPINQACVPPLKNCNGKQIPVNQPCVAPQPQQPKPCPLERVCVQYGKPSPGTFVGPCLRYEMRRQCPVNVR